MFHFLNITTTDIDIIYKVMIPSLSTLVTLMIVYALKPNDKIKYKSESFEKFNDLYKEFRGITNILEDIPQGYRDEEKQKIALRDYVRFYEKIVTIINIQLFHKAILNIIIQDFVPTFKDPELLGQMWEIVHGNFPDNEKIKYQRIIECHSGFWFKRAFFRFLWILEDSFLLRTGCSKIINFATFWRKS
jgi:hypothetical protein